MECKDAKKTLNSLDPGQISPDKQLMEHLGSCPECSAQYAFIKKMDKALSKEIEMPLSADFEGEVWKRIGRKQPVDNKVSWIPVFTWATAAAVMCLAFFAVMTKYPFRQAAQTTAAVTQKAPIKTAALKDDAKKTGVVIKSDTTYVAPEKPAATAVVAVVERAVIQDSQNSGGNRRVFSQVHFGAGKVEEGPANNPGEPVLMEPRNNYTAASVSGELTKTYVKEDAPESNVEVLGNIIRPLSNESAGIKYKVSEEGYVVISIYDRAGKNVRRLFSGPSQPGTYMISWNGMDDGGRAVAAGIYVLFVKTGSYESKSKIGVVK